jgi:hypothetical protein
VSQVAFGRSALACIVATLLGCGDGVGPLSELARAELRWRQSAVQTYSLALTRSCFCGQGATGLVTVSVRGGVVESRIYGDGSPVPENLYRAFPDVPGLFALIGDALRDGGNVTVTYHPILGTPTQAAIDFHPGAIDDEVYYSAVVNVPE